MGKEKEPPRVCFVSHQPDPRELWSGLCACRRLSAQDSSSQHAQRRIHTAGSRLTTPTECLESRVCAEG